MNKIFQRKSGQVWISAVLYLMITGVVMVLLLEAGIPLLEKSRDTSIYERQRDQFLNLNQHIRDVASEGQGSKRIIPLQVEKGDLNVAGNALRWSMITNAKIVEPRSFTKFGDLSVISDFDVTAEKNNGSYMLENSYITVNFTRCEEANNCTFITDIINSISLKGGTPSTGDFAFALDNSSFNGTGSTYLTQEGLDLESASVIVDLALNDYDLHFTLRSREDFVLIEAVKN